MTALGEARSSYDRHFDKLDREILAVQAEQVLLRWMVGFALALHVAILIRVFLR
jgi:hypothetical protein